MSSPLIKSVIRSSFEKLQSGSPGSLLIHRSFCLPRVKLNGKWLSALPYPCPRSNDCIVSVNNQRHSRPIDFALSGCVAINVIILRHSYFARGACGERERTAVTAVHTRFSTRRNRIDQCEKAKRETLQS